MISTTIKIKSISVTNGTLELNEIDGTYVLSFNNSPLMYSKNFIKINNLFNEYLKKMW